jgi:hypothetical protein
LTPAERRPCIVRERLNRHVKGVRLALGWPVSHHDDRLARSTHATCERSQQRAHLHETEVPPSTDPLPAHARAMNRFAHRLSRTVPATILAACAYAGAVVYLAWPLVLAPGTTLVDPLALGTSGGTWVKVDLDLLVWILAWMSHALVSQPLDLFQANIFHPARDTLASSEHLLGLAPIAAPVFWLSGNAVLTYNVTIIVVVWACALCTFVLVRRWTHSNVAAFLAGATFGLGPQLVSSWVRLHSSAVCLFPVVLLLGTRAARDQRPRVLVLLALVTALQALAGVYVAFELAVLIVAFLPAIWLEARRHGRSVLPPMAALAAGGLALLPVTLPYLRVSAAGQLPSLGQAKELIAKASPPPWLLRSLIVSHATWPILGLAVLGLVWSRRVAWNLRLGMLLVGVVGTIFTAGMTLPLVPGTHLTSVYELAMHVVPGFAGMRAPSRFVVLPLLAIAVLAGIGAAQLIEVARTRSRRTASAARVLVVAASAALIVARAPSEPLPLAPAALSGFLGAVDRWLRDSGEPGPVLELPAMSTVMNTRSMFATGRYMVGSTLHWMPLVNGYSGHPPASDRLLMTLAERLPDADALEALCALAAPHWLVVNFGQMPAGEEERWKGVESRLGIELGSRIGKRAVYRVARQCPSLAGALLRQLAGLDSNQTLGGVSLARLPAAAARGSIAGALPTSFPSGTHAVLWLEVRNGGNATWPGLAVTSRGVVEIQARWRDLRTDAIVAETDPLPLARDLAPGERMRAQVNVLAPPMLGEYVLEVALAQRGYGSFAELSGTAVALRGSVVLTQRAEEAEAAPEG